MVPSSSATAAVAAAAAASLTCLLALSFAGRRETRRDDDDRPSSPSSSDEVDPAVSTGGYESLIGNTPLLYLPRISSLLPNEVKIYVKMESLNPGGTGKDRAARSMILDAERRGELPPPLVGNGSCIDGSALECFGGRNSDSDSDETTRHSNSTNDNHHRSSSSSFANIPSDVHSAILAALRNTRTHGVIIEGTSGSTGISLASISCARGHAVIVVLPDDQSKQKADFLRRLGCGVVVVQNCSISNPGHYVNVARRIWEWLEVERRYDGHYWDNVVGKRTRGRANGTASNGNVQTTTIATTSRPPPRLIRAAFMNQFENLANVRSHYTTTGPEIYSQLNGKVDAFVMSAGTGGTLVGVGGYLKERWWRDRYAAQKDGPSSHDKGRNETTTRQSPPRLVLVDPPGSSLFNKVKYNVAYASQQSERKLRRHRYDTLAEGIGLDRTTANFGLGCEDIVWGEGVFGDRIAKLMCDGDAPPDRKSDSRSSKIIDDAIAVTDQQAVYMAHHLLRHEGLFVGSSTAMNLVGALTVASTMPRGSNVATVVCDGGQRHTARFWNRDFVVEEWGLVWPGDDDGDVVGDVEGSAKDDFLKLLGIDSASVR